jgi:hypothetical protein
MIIVIAMSVLDTAVGFWMGFLCGRALMRRC